MFCTSEEWATRGATAEDWSPAEFGGGRGRPAVDVRACFGAGLRLGFPVAQRINAREVEGGHEFELGPKARLQLCRRPFLNLPGGGRLAGEFGLFMPTFLLDAQPATNRWSFQLDVPDNLLWLRQREPPLRPEHVRNSFAVYQQPWPGNLRKVFDVFRGVASDARGDWTWVEVDWDPVTKQLTKIVPQDFLERATYPITVDVVLGYNTVGGTRSSTGGNFIRACGEWTTDATGGNSSAMYVYTDSSAGGPDNMTAGLYDHDNTNDCPENLIEDTDEQSVKTAGWFTFTFDSPVSLSASTNYWPAWNADDNTGWWYDTDSGTRRYLYKSNTYVSGTLNLNPWGSPGNSLDYIVSAYLNYEAAAAAGAPVLATMGIHSTVLGGMIVR